MADYYVDPAAGGDNDGGADGAANDPTDSDNWTDAWTDFQSALDTATAGDIVYCRGTQTLSAVLDLDTEAGTAAGGWIKFIGCPGGDGAVDGTRFVIDADDPTCANCLSIAANFGEWYWFENIEFYDASGDGVGVGAGIKGPIVWINCISHNHGGDGWELYYNSNSRLAHTFIRCMAKDNAGDGFNGGYNAEAYFFCIAKDNTGDGFATPASGTTTYIGCISYNNSDTGYRCEAATYPTIFFNSIADENDDSGFLTKATIIDILMGCRATDNGKDTSGYGIEEIGTGRTLYGWSFLIDNDSGAKSGMTDPIPYNGTADTNLEAGTEGYETGGTDWNLTDSASLRRTAIALPVS